ncbi:hypothetical protein SAZ_31470 [Streptomyces noursei ZPM]|uniref:Uncharacterized protein n=1 Tax=Streptomyces noursei TaxID=1971 RepID=A0A401R9B2_STRNR|nr:hypothetical protein SAZ_31470 [Streptomyces noursei ZPM]EPY92053.1 hypothetical protein K530_55430 [Streptomyces noursei CCRC 11814]GCB94202.1 hypothetical protein SALB_07000 [Streptomyces noursei]
MIATGAPRRRGVTDVARVGPTGVDARFAEPLRGRGIGNDT